MMEDIIITEAAAKKVKELLSADDFKNESIFGLRVYVQGGGCNGFNYGFVFEDSPEEQDAVFEKDGVRFLVDPMSMMYLMGSTVDYSKSLLQDQFVVDNPSAQTTCGCGSSFSI